MPESSPESRSIRARNRWPNSDGETVTEGLDGLRERLQEYYALGARFTKWRAVFRIGNGLPSRYAIDVNAHALGRYAALAQEGGLVPIVEPEVLMDGDHDIERSFDVTNHVLHAVFNELARQRVVLEGIILKPNMATPGSGSARRADPEEVAEHTLTMLRRCVPAAVPGIAFLSGGQTGEEVCANLNAMLRRGPLPWALSYSFGRALQFPALEVWGGREANTTEAAAAFLHRSRMSSLARSGEYSPGHGARVRRGENFNSELKSLSCCFGVEPKVHSLENARLKGGSMRSRTLFGRPLALLLSLALVALLALSLACGDDDDDDDGGDGGGEDTGAATGTTDGGEPTDAGDDGDGGGDLTVTASDFAFEPADLTVTAGSDVSISVTNDGAAPHNLRIAGEDNEFDTDDDAVSDPDNIGAGESGTVEFTAPDAPGSVDFRCDFHPTQMLGTITVE